MSKSIIYLYAGTFLILFLGSCDQDNSGKLFTQLNKNESGILFSNKLKESDSLNYFLYKNLYNGGGVAIGDVNNDGLQDIYFTGNMVDNKLYLNKGDLKFEDITHSAKVGGDERWSTGVTMADVNQDGWMDIYVSVSGIGHTTKNLLYINDGLNKTNPTFTESAESFGLADSGNSSQSVFFDYDLDGDLDLYVANYPIVDIRTGVMNYRENMKRVHSGVSDHLYKYEDGKYVDVTMESGVMSYGLSLGVSVGDYNQDGWPDLYVSNDFATPDYFFFNNGDGSFSEKSKEVTNHTAFFGMGVDAADINNDGLLDFLQVDMTPEDNFRSKANMGSMNTEAFWAMVDNGMHYQYMKNAFQLNMGNDADNLPYFSEISSLANVSFTDWSWSPLLADFDNDGLKDVFVTNGSRREINNKDFFKEMNKDKDQHKHFLEWVKKMPEEKIENYALKNMDSLVFKNIGKKWGINFKGWSNGASYADLDNDGDLDLVVNNIDDSAIIYRNNASEDNENHYLNIKLKGPKQNGMGLGAKVSLLMGYNEFQFQELILTRGFQSSVSPIVHFGLGKEKIIKKLNVVWPDGKEQQLKNISGDQLLTLDYANARLKGENFVKKEILPKLFKTITSSLNLEHKHTENFFDDFAYQLLMPHKMSQDGPALAVEDINNDGLDDIYVGGASGYAGQIYLQTADGQFAESGTDIFAKDKAHEDVDAIFIDANNDEWPDLYIVSGGNEYKENTPFYEDRLYINNKGVFVKATYALPKSYQSGSVVRAADFDNDGDQDLFVGARFSPRNYPMPGTSYILSNTGNSTMVRFEKVDDAMAIGLSNIGMVTDAKWVDIDQDKDLDLILTGEWMPISIFENSNGVFTNTTKNFGLADQTGWWNTLSVEDFDADGDLDILAGNLGENYKYSASHDKPFNIYINDYDDNNTNDIVLSYLQEGKEYPLRGRQCSSEQIPAIAVKFKDYSSFAKATLADVYSTKALEASLHLRANNFSTSYFEHIEGGSFSAKPLEKLAQISSVNAIYCDDMNKDGHLDVVMAGNLYNSEIETPRNDASYGIYLSGNGKGTFKSQMPYESGFMLKGEVRKILGIKLKDNKEGLLIGVNNGMLSIIEIASQPNQ